MAINYDLNNTGPEVQARLDKVFPNEEAISQETANREEADESLLSEMKEYTDTETFRAQEAEGEILEKIEEIERNSATKEELENGLSKKANSANVYTKTETYSKEQLNNMITTPAQQYVSVSANSGTTSVTSLLPATGEADTTYRVGNWDGTQYDTHSSSEYAWDGMQYILLSVRDQLPIDNVPTADSDNPVKSGGVYAADRRLEAKTSAVLNGYFIDYNHLVNSPSGIILEYAVSTSWDAIWLAVLGGVKQITVTGAVTTRFSFFRSFSVIDETTSVGRNTTGEVPNGAVLCIINMKHSDNPDGYDDMVVAQDNRVSQLSDIEALRSNFVGSLLDWFGGDLVIKKNYINKDDLLVGWYSNNNQWVESPNAISSNKIVFVKGQTYALQNIGCYGSNPSPSIYIAHFDNEDNFLGRGKVVATLDGGSLIGKGLYHFSGWSGYAYSRIVLQAPTSATIVPGNCQCELGDTYTEIAGYAETMAFASAHSFADAYKKRVRLLAIGNSYSDDALAYVPYIIKNMGVDIELQIGILMESSTSLSDHVSNFEGQTAAYSYRLFDSLNGIWEDYSSKTIQWALDNYEWDIISLQQVSSGAFNWSTYQPYLNKLINYIGGYVGYPIKFCWYEVQSRPASVNSGANWSDATIDSHFEDIAENAQKVLQQTACEFVVPVGTAIQNARTIAEIKALGAYADNANNTSHLGYLAASDGVHLQEGLPCQIAAYTFVLALIKEYGFENFSIIGEGTRVDAAWEVGKNIPSPHGTPIGSTDANCLIAQISAVMAIKNPYMATDMNYIVNPS